MLFLIFIYSLLLIIFILVGSDGRHQHLTFLAMERSQVFHSNSFLLFLLLSSLFSFLFSHFSFLISHFSFSFLLFSQILLSFLLFFFLISLRIGMLSNDFCIFGYFEIFCSSSSNLEVSLFFSLFFSPLSFFFSLFSFLFSPSPPLSLSHKTKQNKQTNQRRRKRRRNNNRETPRRRIHAISSIHSK